MKIKATLDEYICSLPLEERAKYFIYHSEFYWYSTLFSKDARFIFEEEALQATIEALKQSEEMKINDRRRTSKHY